MPEIRTPEAPVDEPPVDEGAADEFWAFSLDLYARPGVAEACLRLQDAHGLDVNVLLLCCWLARRGCRVSAADLAAAEARAAPLRTHVLVPLRAARRALKTMPLTGAAALYAQVKAVELAVEREEQRLLVAPWSGSSVARSAREVDEAVNLTLYFTIRGLAPEHGAELISILRTAP
jgi:uncharacterized protein (TIGR02444 family)